MSLLVGGIDIGFENMGFVMVEIGTEFDPWEIERVSFLKKINLRNLRHERVSYKDCKLHHTNHMCDVVDHFIQENKKDLDLCHVLLIEQQPPGGFQNVESLLYKEYREKSTIVSPRAMHHFFGIQKFDYEGRKQQTTKIALEMIKTTPDLFERFNKWIELDFRVHDISDALAYVEMFRKKKEEESKKALSRKRPFITTTGNIICWEKYKYPREKISKKE